jgi:RNA polymerase sigma-70 factor (ECF subfamily)
MRSDSRQTVVTLIPRLRRYARALTGNPEQADELVQDCLERGLNRLHLWRRGSDLRAWLFTIMHNLHVNSVRRGGIRPDNQAYDDTRMHGASPPAQDDVVALHSIVGLLRRLPADQREVVLMVGLEELSYREVADVLGVPVGTVMSRLARGRERLRELSGATAPQREKSTR